MEMGSLTLRQYSDRIFQQNKGIKENPREILYLRYINNKCFEFLKMLHEPKYEDVFWGDKAKELTSIFKNFLKVKLQSNFHNFNNINFGLSSVDRIIQLKVELYHLICERLYIDFVVDDDKFQDFFEEFITFTRRIFLKNEEDYEDDIFDINEYRDDFVENDDNDFENEILNIINSDSEISSGSDSEISSGSDSESD